MIRANWEFVGRIEDDVFIHSDNDTLVALNREEGPTLWIDGRKRGEMSELTDFAVIGDRLFFLEVDLLDNPLTLFIIGPDFEESGGMPNQNWAVAYQDWFA